MPDKPAIADPVAASHRIDGIDVHIRRKGEGPALLFLHGGGGVPGWLPFFDDLSRDFDVIVPDHPGFGRSGDATGIASMGDLASFYLKLIAALDLRHVRIVGSSLGGWLAAEIALRDQSDIHSLVLVAPLGLRAEDKSFGDIFSWTREDMMRRMFANPAYSEAALQSLPAEAITTERRNRDAAITIAGNPPFESRVLERQAHRLRLPIQLIWGEGDLLVPPDHARAWQQRVPDARLAFVAECGHLPYIEQSARTRDIIATFLENPVS